MPEGGEGNRESKSALEPVDRPIFDGSAGISTFLIVPVLDWTESIAHASAGGYGGNGSCSSRAGSKRYAEGSTTSQLSMRSSGEVVLAASVPRDCLAAFVLLLPRGRRNEAIRPAPVVSGATSVELTKVAVDFDGARRERLKRDGEDEGATVGVVAIFSGERERRMNDDLALNDDAA
jgi:hypothetical protein